MRPVIRPVAAAFLTLLAFTAVWLTAFSVHAGSRYRDDPRNVRAMAAVDGPRGQIVTADGVVVARDGDERREYPRGDAYAHLVGYDTGEARTGLEATRGRDLLGDDDGSLRALLIRLTGGDLGPSDLRLTVVDEVQRVAVEALRGQRGAIVALDPSTGAVLAYASSPTFDPNLAPEQGEDTVSDAARFDRVARRLLPPGSTFKLVVAAAALAAGAEPGTFFDDADSYTPPGGGQPIRNASGRTCAGGGTITLLDAFVVSCNTVFAELAVALGGEPVVDVAERLGFNRAMPWELPWERSVIPQADVFDADPPALAQSGIGERDVRATPLLLAMIAAAVANDGVAMAPYVVDASIGPRGSVTSVSSPRALGRVLDRGVAGALTEMMVAVVERGTGTAAAVRGTTVAGKTGTAEGGGGPHAWFIGFAPADEPTIAVVVVVEAAGSGGRVAAPLASRVIQAWLDYPAIGD